MLILLGWNSRIFDGRRECVSHEIPNPAKKYNRECIGQLLHIRKKNKNLSVKVEENQASKDIPFSREGIYNTLHETDEQCQEVEENAYSHFGDFDNGVYSGVLRRWLTKQTMIKGQTMDPKQYLYLRWQKVIIALFAVVMLKYCRFGLKHQIIDPLINHCSTFQTFLMLQSVIFWFSRNMLNIKIQYKKSKREILYIPWLILVISESKCFANI